MKLTRHIVEKPWGRENLPAPFSGLRGGKEPIGEIWFVDGQDAPPPLLVKYIFTSEKLSVQVHPDDAQAQARGLPGGKTECWFIIDADPGARLGLGTRTEMTGEEVRQAALDGSITGLMEWVPVRRGDFIFVPAGTIHAIGGGISLIEVQQNNDVTYRLYDYGRPRELHLDEGVSVADARPHLAALRRHIDDDMGEEVLVDCDLFTVVHSRSPLSVRRAHPDRQMWLMPLEGELRLGADSCGPGDCLWLDEAEQDDIEASSDIRVLVAIAA